MDASGIITTVAGGGRTQDVEGVISAIDAQLRGPAGIALDASGNLFIAERSLSLIRKVDASGTIRTIAGGFIGEGNPAIQATLVKPRGLFLAPSGDLYISDTGHQLVRKVDAVSGIITTVAGNGSSGFSGDGGPATGAALNQPGSLVVDGAGNLYVMDSGHIRVRRIGSDGIISTVVGKGSVGFSPDGTPATEAQLGRPAAIAIGPSGAIYLADKENHRIRVAMPGEAVVLSLAIGADRSEIFGDDADAATIEVRILDGDGNLQSSDKSTVVDFTIVQGEGTLSSSQSTAVGGIATIALTSDSTGVVKVRAGIKRTDPVEVVVTVKPRPLNVITLAIDPDVIATGGSSTLRAELRDPDGNLESSDHTGRISFRLLGSTVGGAGSLSAEEVAVSGGIATTTLLGDTPGVLVVEATAPGARGARQTVRVTPVSFPGGESPASLGSDGAVPIRTVAGGKIGDMGPATAAILNQASGMAIDGSGNLYIADRDNHRVRRIDPQGTITTVAGNGESGVSGDGGPATGARLHFPEDISVDASGNLFVADRTNERVRKVDASSGTISTVAGGRLQPYDNTVWDAPKPATDAVLVWPMDVFVDASGSIYIVDQNDHRIVKVDPSGIMSTLAGNGEYGFSGDGGPATAASLFWPGGVFVDGSGDVYIADTNNHRIRKVDATGTITTVVGNGSPEFSGDGGPATLAGLDHPNDVVLDASGNLFIADRFNHRIRKVDASSGTISTVAGSGDPDAIGTFAGDGGPATRARLRAPFSVAVDASGSIYISDYDNYRIRKVDPSGTISTIAGNGTFGSTGDGGPATLAEIGRPYQISVDGAGNVYYACSWWYRVRKVDLTGTISTVAGSRRGGGPSSDVGDGGPATDAVLFGPGGLAVDDDGNLYIADSSNRRVRKVDAVGRMATVAGGGRAPVENGAAAIAVELGYPQDIALDDAGNLYILEADRVLKVDPPGTLTILAGGGSDVALDGIAATEAALVAPYDTFADDFGNLYIVDRNGGRILRVDASGTISIYAGSDNQEWGDGGPATDAGLTAVSDIAADDAGNLYIAEPARIRKVDVSGIITTVVGDGVHRLRGFYGDGEDAHRARLNDPSGISLDRAGNLYIADRGNHRVRKVDLSDVIPPVLGVFNGARHGFTPELEWEEVSTATSYTLEYGSDAGFADPVTVEGLTESRYVFPSSLPEGTYFWRVGSVGTRGESGFSRTDRFRIAPNHVPIDPPDPGLPAFPGAMGFGAATPGGRGGRSTW